MIATSTGTLSIGGLLHPGNAPLHRHEVNPFSPAAGYSRNPGGPHAVRLYAIPVMIASVFSLVIKKHIKSPRPVPTSMATKSPIQAFPPKKALERTPVNAQVSIIPSIPILDTPLSSDIREDSEP